MTEPLLPQGITREEAYEERIAHLRTAIEMLAEDADWMRARMGMPPMRSPQRVLEQDVQRSIEQDKL